LSKYLNAFYHKLYLTAKLSDSRRHARRAKPRRKKRPTLPGLKPNLAVSEHILTEHGGARVPLVFRKSEHGGVLCPILYRETIRNAELLLVEGQLQREGGALNVIVKRAMLEFALDEKDDKENSVAQLCELVCFTPLNGRLPNALWTPL
jgi:hypothetical protein